MNAAVAGIGRKKGRVRHWTRSASSALTLLTITLSAAWAGPLAAGCGGAGWRSGNYTLDHGGVARIFRLHVPKGYKNDAPTPLVLAFHGWGGDENEFLDDATVTTLADQRGYILVAPRGLGSGEPDQNKNSWTFSGSASGLDGDGLNKQIEGDTDATCDQGITPDYSYASCAGVKANTCSWTHCQDDDVAFTMALVSHVSDKLCVDAGRVYATGGSNGGMFTWELAQNASSARLLRAIAPLIGLPHRGYLAGQGKQGDLPALLITGIQDKVVPPGEWEASSYTTTSNDRDRFYYSGATAIIRSWSRAHGCNIETAAAPFDDGIRESDCRSYCSGDPGWPRVLDCRAEMGHSYSLPWTWQLILDFFDQHSQ